MQFIRCISDIHQEFGLLEDIPEFPEDRNTVMILAGDIGMASKPHTYLPLLEECEKRFAQTIYVLGNHEHYSTSLLRAHDKINDQIQHAGLKKVLVWDESGIYKRYNIWIHGHTHMSNDFKLHKTRIICNPRGYVGHELNPDFDPGFRVKV